MNVPPSRKAKVTIVTNYPEAFGEAVYPFFERLASAQSVELCDSYSDDTAVRIITDSAAIYMPLADIIDFEAEKKRLGTELDKVNGEIARLEGKLSNESFTSRAPACHRWTLSCEKLARYIEKKNG